MRFLPLVLVFLFLAIGVGWRSWWQHRRYGTWGMALFRGHGRWLEAAAVLAPLLLVADAAAAVWRPTLFAPLPLPRLVALVGAAIVLAALALMVVAQLDLGASWRVGIDPGARPGLVTDGAYRYSRNPIFACMLLALAGFALVLPDVCMLTLAAGGCVVVWRQVGAEERYLAATYGDAYEAYKRRVRRF